MQLQVSSHPSPPGTASKLDSCENFLVEYLVEHHAEFDNGANTKGTTWEAISHLLSERYIEGGPKTTDSCKQKYGKVYSSFPRGTMSINEIILAEGNFQCNS
jgi:hypothetical protein